jgi:hypothetical protein
LVLPTSTFLALQRQGPVNQAKTDTGCRISFGFGVEIANKGVKGKKQQCLLNLDSNPVTDVF